MNKKIRIGLDYLNNLLKMKKLIRLAISDSKDSSLIHILNAENLTVCIEPTAINAICYECGDRIQNGKGVSLGVFYKNNKIIKFETYFFHKSHLFQESR